MQHAVVGWAILFGYVAVYDYYAITTGKETLSSACHRGMEHRYIRIPVALWMIILIKHLGLKSFLPDYDLIAYIGKSMAKKVSDASLNI